MLMPGLRAPNHRLHAPGSGAGVPSWASPQRSWRQPWPTTPVGSSNQSCSRNTAVFCALLRSFGTLSYTRAAKANNWTQPHAHIWEDTSAVDSLRTPKLAVPPHSFQDCVWQTYLKDFQGRNVAGSLCLLYTLTAGNSAHDYKPRQPGCWPQALFWEAWHRPSHVTSAPATCHPISNGP